LFQRVWRHPLFPGVYSAAVTAALAVVVCFTFLRPVQSAGGPVDFDRIRVHRIDVVEPDGTERMIIADRAQYPGSFFHGKEIARADRRDSAGMLFINDEGTEDGGLIYGGSRSGGKPSSFGHLSFDQYEQDQTVVVGSALAQDGTRTAGFALNDAPDAPITPELYDQAERIKGMPHGEAREKAWGEFMKVYPMLHQRAGLQRAEDGSVGLMLRDKDGRVRLRMQVASDGEPAIQLLDAQGNVKRTISIASAEK
jgi:hypothetical protein